jgi:hypothetical protein
MAAGIDRRNSFELPRYLANELIAEAYALEDAFFYKKRLEAAQWEELARRFEEIDRPFRADYAREKLRRLQIVQREQLEKQMRQFSD